jgi:hypothetical protein
MNTKASFPAFDDTFSELNQFILGLAKAYEGGDLKSWGELEKRTKAYFTTEKMEQMDSVVPHWRAMASYKDGVTLTHVMCVFLGLVMLPEFRSLAWEAQQLAKWIVLFHDVEKEVKPGQKDTKHAFRSAINAARQLPKFGFAVTGEYDRLISQWSELTYSAITTASGFSEPVQDNKKLPEILTDLERMFGADTPAAMIVKGVLLHMSINVVNDWPQAAPLTKGEIKGYITRPFMPLLKVMMLSDNEGWVMFSPEREIQRKETLKAFQTVEKIISE